MTTKLSPPPHRPPLVQIKNKKFRYLKCKYVYPLIHKSDSNLDFDLISNLNKIRFFTAPYFQNPDTYNVHVTYMSKLKAEQMKELIYSYYGIQCESIRVLREDMEHLSSIKNIPLVIVRSYNTYTDTFELSYKY